MQKSPELAAARAREQAAYQHWQQLHEDLKNLTIPVDVETEAYEAYARAAAERSRLEAGPHEHFYQGVRSSADYHCTEVFVDGQPLPMTELARRKSPSGYEWSYGGSGPAALAHSLLAHEFGEDAAQIAYQDFKWAVIANLDYTGWTLTSTEIRQAVDKLTPATIEDAAQEPIDDFVNGFSETVTIVTRRPDPMS